MAYFMVSIAAGATVEVPSSDKHSGHQNAGEETTYQFRQRTRLRINGTTEMELNMDCDAMSIGDKEMSLEITSVDGDQDIELNMTCREEESQLGVEAGKTVRNRNRVRMNYGFAVNITANQSCTAKLGMEMSQSEANGKTWAYFDEEADEWVPVESEFVDGELLASTDHFSVWTIVDDAMPITTMILIGAGAVAAVGIVLYAIKKRQ
ncbi:MAG: hypothetical protein GF364_05365 [Candidatus Lokiarchaeota archaeon]|nr:hypothetical protein [Candidatus Lokiarchaeota archaeon]